MKREEKENRQPAYTDCLPRNYFLKTRKEFRNINALSFIGVPV
jgi:hypothetical protein